MHMRSAAEPLSASNGEPPLALLAGEVLAAWNASSEEPNGETLHDATLDGGRLAEPAAEHILTPDRSCLASLALAPSAAALTRVGETAWGSSSSACIPKTRIGPSAFSGTTRTELSLFASVCTHRACGDGGLGIAMGSIGPAIDEPLAEAKGNSSAAPVQFIHRDALGSITAVTNASGAVIYRMGYRAFGERTLTQAPQSGQQILMTGLSYTSRENSVGNLYNYRSRYYDAGLGRFLSQDSYRGQEVSPPSTHRYVYTLNNPVRYTDPSGKSPVLLILGVLFVVGTVLGFIVASALYSLAAYGETLNLPPPLDQPQRLGEHFLGSYALSVFLGFPVCIATGAIIELFEYLKFHTWGDAADDLLADALGCVLGAAVRSFFTGGLIAAFSIGFGVGVALEFVDRHWFDRRLWQSIRRFL